LAPRLRNVVDVSSGRSYTEAGGRTRRVRRYSRMSDLFSFVALSLLPPWGRLAVAERLRAGDPPGVVLARLLPRYWRDQPEERETLAERARAAIDRAAEQRIAPLVWSDAAYPPALATIADPPAMVWV